MKMPRPKSLTGLLTQPENLYAAWQKLRNFFRDDGVWFDEMEVTLFEANLESELKAIANQFSRLSYRMTPLSPIPFPKRSDKPDEKVRQSFWISVRDQVAWIAFVNVVGPWLDVRMPAWSYGHRLYRSVWVDESEEGRKLKVGWYRHSRGLLYRKFSHSWPLFRRHVLLTARQMASVPDKVRLEEAEERIWQDEQSLDDRYRLSYLKPDYWANVEPKRPKELFWASIDLEKFYPKIRLDTVKGNLARFSRHFSNDVTELAGSLLRFPLDTSQFSEEHLERMGLRKNQRFLPGIPTGLAVAGFLANVALLGVDEAVVRLLDPADAEFHSRVAHFRYVDDHMILATDGESLLEWIGAYERLLNEHSTGCVIKWSKTKPAELATLLEKQVDRHRILSNPKTMIGKLPRECHLDPRYPSPLMTETLALVSQLAQTEFLLLDEAEQGHFLQEVEHLLLAEFPDEEIRRDTRMSFAAGLLARCAALRTYNPSELVEANRKLVRLQVLAESLRTRLRDGKARSAYKKALRKSAGEVANRVRAVSKKIADLQSEREKWESKHANGVARLLLKAVHDYPEKPRLWLRLLEFLRSVGQPDLTAVVEELEHAQSSNDISSPFLRALVTQAMARHIISCCHEIKNSATSDEERLRAARFFLGIVRQSESSFLKKQHYFFESRARQLLECAIGTAREMLKDLSLAERIHLFGIPRLGAIIGECRAVNWSDARAWARSTDFGVEQWAYWAELKTCGVIGTEPCPFWSKIINQLDRTLPISWHLLARYPEHLSNSIVRKDILRPGNRAVASYLSKYTEGWIRDVLSPPRRQDIPPHESLTAPAPVKRVLRWLRVSQAKEKFIGLHDWANWSLETYETNPHDPRVGEWTALEIVRQVAEELVNVRFLAKWKGKVYPVNPCNIWLPRLWIAAKDDPSPITWEKWRRLTEHKDIVSFGRISRRDVIFDERYTPYWEPNPVTDRQWASIHGLGLLLLGLLRRSFSWPAAWNLRSGRRDRPSLARRLIDEVVCSSYTLAILNACLAQRPKESILLHGFLQEPPVDDDTTFDPPSIQNADEFATWVGKAQSVLKDYQLTIQNHLPRQMVPINLRQLARPSEPVEMDEEHE